MDEELRIELIADEIFELDQFPDDYSQLAEKNWYQWQEVSLTYKRFRLICYYGCWIVVQK